MRFRNSPLSRPGRAGLLRNAAIVLGNARHPSAEPALIAALVDPEPMIRGAAAWALGQLGTPTAVSTIRKHRELELDESVMQEIESALQFFPVQNI